MQEHLHLCVREPCLRHDVTALLAELSRPAGEADESRVGPRVRADRIRGR